MIIRPLTLTINNDKATLNEKVTLFLGDGGICLEIQLKSVKYGFNGSATIHDESIDYADSCMAYVQKPSGDLFKIPTVQIENNKVHIYVEKSWTDEPALEVGKHLIQIVLHSSDGSQITMPTFEITVNKPLIVSTELLTEDDIELLTENMNGIRISQLDTTKTNTGYIPIVQNNTTKKLNINLDQYSTTEHTHNEVNGYKVVVLSQIKYNQLQSKDEDTIYFIKGE